MPGCISAQHKIKSPLRCISTRGLEPAPLGLQTGRASGAGQMLVKRHSFVTSSFSTDRAARLLEDETLSFQFGALRGALFRAWLALENGHVWLEQGRVYCASSRDAKTVYVVSAGRCSCPARALCYHRVARRLLLRFFALSRAVEADLDDWGPSYFSEQSLTLH
jgi:hypothetical protein